MMMPKRMQIAPTDWMGVKVSFRKMTPRMAAMSGLSAVNRPAFSALVYFWATGWKVKPKTEQMKAAELTHYDRNGIDLKNFRYNH